MTGMIETLPTTAGVIQSLGRLEGKMDAVLMAHQEMNKKVDTLYEKLDKQSDRIKTLETYKETQAGQLKVIIFVCTVACTGLSALSGVALKFFLGGH